MTLTTPPAMMPLGLTRDEKGRFTSRTRNSREFWKRVDRSKIDGCWPWTGAIDATTGYGRLSWEGRYWAAHRLALTLARGPIPPGMFVLHACDKPACCKPLHLWAGTHAANMRDASDKNRMHPGETHGMAKLTDAEARDIIQRLKDGEPGVDIAAAYGIHPNTVYSIKSGRNWKSVR